MDPVWPIVIDHSSDFGKSDSVNLGKLWRKWENGTKPTEKSRSSSRFDFLEEK